MALKQTETTQPPTQQFNLSGEDRDGSRYTNLTGERGEGEDEDINLRSDTLDLNKKTSDKRNLLKSGGGSRFGRHSGITASDVDYTSVDQIDKLNNWGEFQNLLEGIKEKKSAHRE
jgi:hypothetical protein